MDRPTELCLGTVQLGMPYGVTNRGGKIPENEVKNILELAAKLKIRMLDTAQSYGTAELMIGKYWPKKSTCQIISKLQAKGCQEAWEKDLQKSLQNLKTKKLDAFLLHHASELLSPGGDKLMKWLEEIQKRGTVARIGVSIYEAEDIEKLPLERIQLVQLPLSIYDQRLINDGTIKKLNEMGIAVHARSVLLQGLIMESHDKWPNYLSRSFREHHMKWTEYNNIHGMSPLESALGSLKGIKGIEAVLVGVQSCKELTEVVEAWGKAKQQETERLGKWAWQHKVDLDPRGWAKS